jgi:hypothetical protein
MAQTFPLGSSSDVAWASEIATIIADEHAHDNVRLFLTRLVLLRPMYFAHLAVDLFAPMIQLATKPAFGRGVHYFLRDVCVTLLTWSAAPVTASARLPPLGAAADTASVKLMSHLVRNVAHVDPAKPGEDSPSSVQQVVRENLRLIKAFLAEWGDRASIPKPDILGWLCYDSKHASAKIARMCGVQIVGAIASTGQPIYSARTDASIISEETFYERFVANLFLPITDVVNATAEIAGMSLAVLRHLSTADAAAQGSELDPALGRGAVLYRVTCNAMEKMFTGNV